MFILGERENGCNDLPWPFLFSLVHHLFLFYIYHIMPVSSFASSSCLVRETVLDSFVKFLSMPQQLNASCLVFSKRQVYTCCSSSSRKRSLLFLRLFFSDILSSHYLEHLPFFWFCFVSFRFVLFRFNFFSSLLFVVWRVLSWSRSWYATVV